MYGVGRRSDEIDEVVDLRAGRGYIMPMSIDRILISLGVVLLAVSAVLAAIAWL